MVQIHLLTFGIISYQDKSFLMMMIHYPLEIQEHCDSLQRKDRKIPSIYIYIYLFCVNITRSPHKKVKVLSLSHDRNWKYPVFSFSSPLLCQPTFHPKATLLLLFILFKVTDFQEYHSLIQTQIFLTNPNSTFEVPPKSDFNSEISLT